MVSSMNKQKGFTLLELVLVVVVLFAAGALFWSQKNDLQRAHDDSDRKTAINSMYYHLEEIYYPTNQSYPEQITEQTLKGINPDLLKDPSGIAIGEADSTLRYEPTNCSEGKCQGYTLRADLDKEADFVKNSRR